MFEGNIHWFILGAAILLIILVILYRRFKANRSLVISDLDSLNEFIKPYGYLYDIRNDLFYSTMDAWQRDMGYTRLYDESAAPMSMIIDSEPIYFNYDNKRWMIEFWKGQYGMTTGFEVGVYYTEDENKDDEYFKWTFYDCVDDDNLLNMGFILVKDGRLLMKRRDRHWWLTGFKLGEFTNPDELVAQISIKLKDINMRNAFLLGMRNAGYKWNEIPVNGNIVTFVFKKPRTPQPFTRIDEFDKITQKKNRLLCDEYNNLTKDYKNSLDKIIALQRIKPELVRNIVFLGKSKSLFNIIGRD